MLRRAICILLTTVVLALLGAATPGCKPDNDVKVEHHEEVNVEETVSTRMKVE
jgi:hypothetical protein